MNRLEKEFLEFIKKNCITYLREDKINKFDSDEKFNDELYIISSVSVNVILSDYVSYQLTSISTGEVINNDGRPYTSGFILFDKFRLNIMVDPKMKFIDHRFWITHDIDLTYTKDSYKMPEKFEVLFF